MQLLLLFSSLGHLKTEKESWKRVFWTFCDSVHSALVKYLCFQKDGTVFFCVNSQRTTPRNYSNFWLGVLTAFSVWHYQKTHPQRWINLSRAGFYCPKLCFFEVEIFGSDLQGTWIDVGTGDRSCLRTDPIWWISSIVK